MRFNSGLKGVTYFTIISLYKTYINVFLYGRGNKSIVIIVVSQDTFARILLLENFREQQSHLKMRYNWERSVNSTVVVTRAANDFSVKKLKT
jgi:hypothetical protein